MVQRLYITMLSLLRLKLRPPPFGGSREGVCFCRAMVLTSKVCERDLSRLHPNSEIIGF